MTIHVRFESRIGIKLAGRVLERIPCYTPTALEATRGSPEPLHPEVIGCMTSSRARLYRIDASVWHTQVYSGHSRRNKRTPACVMHRCSLDLNPANNSDFRAGTVQGLEHTRSEQHRHMGLGGREAAFGRCAGIDRDSSQ